MESLRSALEALGGVARGTQLRRRGFNRERIGRAVASGNICRIRDGVFALSTTDPVIITAAHHGGAVTCTTALHLYGLWVLPAEKHTHVWLGQNVRRHQHPECHCIEHRHRGKSSLGTVDIETALVHHYHCAGSEAFFTAYESALRQRRIPPHSRERLRHRLPSRAHWLIDLARTDADSGLESLLRLRLHLAGIAVTSQVRIPGVGCVDFVIDGHLIIEADGRDNHDSPTHRHKDLLRDAAASRLGYETLRFDYAQIVHDWESVLHAIVSAIARHANR
ncbi:endonuclease domain-containing protein [Microbacterium sp. YY-01]|uniref:endonuclease domain-containing protein n=1 Tax=Microbacterium sp. YY-01 TaxID=3421634 RepID=UPI003D1830CA